MIIKLVKPVYLFVLMLSVTVIIGLIPEPLDARGGARGGGGGGGARSSVNRGGGGARASSGSRQRSASAGNRSSSMQQPNRKPSSGNKKPSSGNKKPSSGNKKPSSGNKKPSGGNNKPGGGNNRPDGGNRPDRDIDIDNSVNIDVDGHHGGCCYGGYGHPIAAGVAIATTAAIVGSVIYSLPAGCTTVITNGISYQQCGSTWYQPNYVGNDVTYVVVDTP